ncbi:TonB-dependent receptor [Novosphingobium sp. FSW06-99]|uniref:TonB-dependent receptor n=1 Tax=Novosphingobium sp. FSW06-99 TaxID=1739113 RepID=UPI00076D9A21|nr:TonB-dependent receptor [Novosphingobium sp. FSW06-99]KUR79759.1 hypothetical protein AQZ49_04405 [Novosphingobium sp. FSW06-99]
MRTIVKILLATGSALGLATAVSAQTTPAAPAQSTDASAPVGDIIVTAQRRSESVQKVPIAIDVVSGKTLRNSAATQLSDIRQFASSVQFTETPAEPTFSIRGIGTNSFDYSVEQAVGLALDDVNITLPRVNVLSILSDVDRVEVLHGPQGTLFGKNTTAGLISITTHRPELNVLSDEAHLQVGSRDQVEVYDIINIPVGDRFALRLSAGYHMQNSPLRTLGPGTVAATNDQAFKAKALWEPNDRLTIYAIADMQYGEGDPGVWTVRSFGQGTYAPAVGNQFVRTTLTALGVVPGPDNDVAAIGTDNYLHTRSWGGQITVDYRLGEATMTSVTAYRHLERDSNLEADETPLTVLNHNTSDLEAHQFSQELRLSLPTGHVFDPVFGLYYFEQGTTAQQDQSGGLGYLPNGFALRLSTVGGLSNYAVTSRSYAAFGQTTVHLADRFRVIAGARYTVDDLTSSFFVSPLAGVCSPAALLTGGVPGCLAYVPPSLVSGGSRDHGDWSGRTGVEYDLAPHTMAYATASRGYKGAAVSTVSGYVFQINPETVVSVELGIKAALFDRRLTLDLALFHSKFSDFQTEVFDPSLGPTGAFRTGNAGGLRAQGVEAQATARPLPGLTLTGGVTYNDAHYTNYDPPCYAGQTLAQGCNLPGPTFNAAGDRLTNAPRWSETGSLGYRTEIGHDLAAHAGIDWSARSSVQFGVGDPGTIQAGYSLVNASIGIGDTADHLRLGLFVRNLFDKRFAAQIFSSFFDTGGYSQVLPDAAFRRFGATLDWHF